MKKAVVSWFAAAALILLAGTGFATTLNSGGMHGHGGAGQRQGFEHRGLVHRPHPGFVRPHEVGRSHHFHRHARVIIIGGPFFGPPIYYATPVYVAPAVNYRYYCTDPGGYYPEIQSCPSGWLRVIPDNSSY